jgi:hypothetical protein
MFSAKKISLGFVTGALFWASLTVTPPLFSTGCATAERQQFNTISGLVKTVDGRLKTYFESVALGHVSAADQARVETVKAQYEADLKAAVAATEGNQAAAPPAAFEQTARQFLNLLNAVTR